MPRPNGANRAAATTSGRSRNAAAGPVPGMVAAAAEAVETWWRDGWEAALPLGNRKVEA